MNANSVNDLVSESRAFIMGVVMIVIMLFHASFGFLGKLGLLFSIYGHWGVDIFLYLSGFGLYYALRKNEGNTLLQFYNRRAVRILPAAILVGTVLYAINYAGILGVLGLNLWYIRTLVVLYVCSPFIYKLCIKNNPFLFFIWIMMIAVCVVLVSVPVLKDTGFLYQSSISWTAARLPVFCLGMLMAHHVVSIPRILRPMLLLFFAVVLILLLILHYQRHVLSSLSSYLHLLPYILLAGIVPYFCIILGGFYRMLPRCVCRPFVFLGRMSLEIYLVHEAVFRYVGALAMPSYAKFLLAYTMSLVTAFCVHVTINWMSRRIFHRS